LKRAFSTKLVEAFMDAEADQAIVCVRCKGAKSAVWITAQ
jgi:hypothetical protein